MNEKVWDKIIDAATLADELDLRGLFQSDPQRAERFTATAAGWTLDYAKNLITPELMQALLELAEAYCLA